MMKCYTERMKAKLHERDSSPTHKIAVYAKDSDLQRLDQLSEILKTEWEKETRAVLSDSELIKRCIYALWKINFGDRK